jgi:hypothetical protein
VAIVPEPRRRVNRVGLAAEVTSPDNAGTDTG